MGEDSFLQKPLIRIVGSNNTIEFGDHCSMGRDCTFWLDGNNMRITIGSHTTFTRNCNFTCQEDGMSITVGEDCMFSNTIVVRTSDSHKMYNVETGERINPPKDVRIGNHVWIAPNSKVMKGASIGDGSIVGSNTMVTKPMPENSLIVGMPAKVVKQGVSWSRENIFW